MKKYSDRILTVAFVFVIFFITTMILLPFLQQILHLNLKSRAGMLTVSVFQNLLAFIAPSFAAAWMLSRRPAGMLRLKRAPSLRAVIGILITFALAYPALNQVIYWNSNISFPSELETLEAQLKEMEETARQATDVLLSTKSVGGLIVNLLFISLLTAFGEELFFRGSLQTTAASNGAVHTSIWVVALIFSAFHFQIYGFVPRMLLGAWFGYLLYWTGSIYVPVIAHAINNGVVVVCGWLAARGNTTIDFEMLGVTEYGFPMKAFISAVATLLFLYFLKDFFFNSRNKLKYDTKKTGVA